VQLADQQIVAGAVVGLVHLAIAEVVHEDGLVHERALVEFPENGAGVGGGGGRALRRGREDEHPHELGGDEGVDRGPDDHAHRGIGPLEGSYHYHIAIANGGGCHGRPVYGAGILHQRRGAGDVVLLDPIGVGVLPLRHDEQTTAHRVDGDEDQKEQLERLKLELLEGDVVLEREQDEVHAEQPKQLEDLQDSDDTDDLEEARDAKYAVHAERELADIQRERGDEVDPEPALEVLSPDRGASADHAAVVSVVDGQVEVEDDVNDEEDLKEGADELSGENLIVREEGHLYGHKEGTENRTEKIHKLPREHVDGARVEQPLPVEADQNK
jgi:hypothetical protein